LRALASVVYDSGRTAKVKICIVGSPAIPLPRSKEYIRMRSRTSRAARGHARRADVRVVVLLRRLGLLALLLALAATAVFVGVRRAGAQRRASVAQASPSIQPSQPETNVTTESVKPVSVTTVSFRQLAERQTAARAAAVSKGQTLQVVRPPLTAPDSPPGAPVAQDTSAPRLIDPQREEDLASGPLAPSPAPAQSFLAQEDGPKTGTLNFTIPPSPTGAVGIDKVFTNTNSNYRIHNKATGAPLSTVSIDTFWAASGGSGFFDPQIQYDPYNQRWILAVASNGQTNQSSIEIAVSQTSDPQGSYNLYRFVVAATIGGQISWGDFPMLGFNKNWIGVGYNMFTISTGANNDARILVLDYPSARSGAASPAATIFTGLSGLCDHPVTTYSATENNLYVVKHISSASGTYRVETITGTPAGPSITVGANKARAGGGWIQPSGDILPQTCVPGTPVATYQCPASPRFLGAPDSQVRTNPVFRNGKIYYAQTVGIDTNANLALDHTAAQWTVLDASAGNFANFLDGGRVEDATATSADGGHWYAYPSITANKNGDVLLGFSEFQSNDYADAGYTFRLASDASGTMRDPVTYKEGEDYYEKTGGGTSNRWGDYSHTVVDPVNDRDMWTIQEYAQARVSATNGLGTNDSRWGTYWAKVAAPAGSGELLISEFRLNGPGGATDEFVEIYNNSDTPHTVAAVDGAGYALAASDGTICFTIPNGTTIPARGHYLGVNSAGYSLGNYPAGVATTATGDATYTTDIPLNAGIALFNTTTVANFSTSTRIDAAGSTTEANTLYKEGTGYPAISNSSADYSFNRDQCGKGGSVTTLGGCPQVGFPKDTNNNASDFVFQDTQGAQTGAGQRLGAPGPENLSSPVLRNAQIGAFLLDATAGSSSSPNRFRDFTPGPAVTSSNGTLAIRRRFVNNTGSPVTRLRFRIIDVSTFPSSITSPGFADLRAVTSSDVVISNIMDSSTCGAVQTPPATPPIAPCSVTVHGTTLEETTAGLQQPNGGGINSSLSVTLPGPLAPGASINVQLVLGVQSGGTFKFFVNVEALP
jgi:hypothetical protein